MLLMDAKMLWKPLMWTKESHVRPSDVPRDSLVHSALLEDSVCISEKKLTVLF